MLYGILIRAHENVEFVSMLDGGSTTEMQETLEGKIGMSVVRIADLAQRLKDTHGGMERFKGLMLALTIIHEEFTGRTVADGLSPKEVYAWAVSLGQKGSIQ